MPGSVAIAAVLLLSAATSAATIAGHGDVMTTDEQGRTIVLRTSEYPDPTGTKTTIVQRLLHLGGHHYEIDPLAQPRSTQEFHVAFCAAWGMQPSRGKGVISGENAIGGFSCLHTEPRGQPEHGSSAPHR